MSTPVDAVSLCNAALDGLGSAAIVANIESPVSTLDKIAARHYDVERRALLRCNIWNFALAQQTINKNNTSSILGYTDAYTLPNDFIRVAGIQDDKDYSYRQIKYRRVGNSILLQADGASSVELVYVSDFSTVSLMDPSFVKAFISALSLAFAMPVTKDQKIVEQCNKMFQLDLMEAISADGQEDPPTRYERSRVIEARKGYGDYGSYGSYDNTRYNTP